MIILNGFKNDFGKFDFCQRFGTQGGQFFTEILQMLGPSFQFTFARTSVLFFKVFVCILHISVTFFSNICIKRYHNLQSLVSASKYESNSHNK